MHGVADLLRCRDVESRRQHQPWPRVGSRRDAGQGTYPMSIRRASPGSRARAVRRRAGAGATAVFLLALAGALPLLLAGVLAGAVALAAAALLGEAAGLELAGLHARQADGALEVLAVLL